MATSGNFNTSNQYIKFWIECNQNSQNISNNSSNVTVKLWVKRFNEGYTTYGSGTVWININGSEHSQGITSSQKITSTPICLIERTVDVGHNSDGTKVLSVGGKISHSQFNSGASFGFADFGLSTIARKSSFSLNDYNVTFGSTNVVVTIHRASGSFTHHVVYSARAGHYWTGTTNATDSFSFTPSINDSSYHPSSTSGIGSITVKTYNGSTYIGEETKNINVYVPSSVVPTVNSLGIDRNDNGVPSDWGIYVQGKSKATISIWGANGSHGSWITSYKIDGPGGPWTSWQITTGEIWSTGNVGFSGTITDSRGRTATVYNSIYVHPYSTPSISYYEAYRSNSSGNKDEVNGTYIRALANYSTSSVGGKNGSYCIVKYKRVSDSSWSADNWISSGNATVVGGGGISLDSSYHIFLYIADSFTHVSQTLVVSSGSVTFELRRGGKGLAIGKSSEYDMFEVGWSAKFYNGIDQSSDKNRKIDINYIDEIRPFTLNYNTPFRDFVVNDLKFATFYYKNDVKNMTDAHLQLGFIAQDIAETEIGSILINGEDGNMSFSISSYVTAIAKALKEEILFRDNQIELLIKDNNSMKEKIQLLEEKFNIK